MESEKVKEIKKKLKERYCYLDQAYSDHLAYGGKADEQQEEEIYFLGDIRTLINELESENEWLVGKIKEKNNESADYLLKIQQLKDRIAELEKENENLKKQLIAIDTLDETNFKKRLNAIVFITEKQLKQFADMLKKQMSEGEFWGQKYKLAVFRDIDIDETLNEFLKGENNE